jgi:tetratricopeptide (TPR) repeat protein
VTAPPSTPNKNEDPGGFIEIVPSKNAPLQRGGSETVGGGRNEAETLSRVAVQHYQVGDHGKAADAFEKALRAGADPGATNQRLAQCYEKLNRRAEALLAYQRALKGYEAALAAGRGNPERLRSAIAACQQAIRVAQH